MSKKRGGDGGAEEEEKEEGRNEMGNKTMSVEGEGEQLSIKDKAVMRRMKRRDGRTDEYLTGTE